MRYQPHIGALVVFGVMGSLACHDSTSSSTGSVTLSAVSRAVSLREDSLRLVTDSVAVSLGAGNTSAAWTATHGGGTWLTLITASGTGSGVVRWRRDATVLRTGFTYVDTAYVDTITVTLQGTGGASASLVDSVTVRDAPLQFIAVRRPWRPGERDSQAAYIVRTGALGDFSGVATQALAQEDATVDVILNPAWHGSAGSPPAGVQFAPQFAAGWGARGLDILVVFDSVPGGTIQRDSLNWIAVRWWNPADSTWKGWMINATPLLTFPSGVAVSTAGFDAASGHSGVGGGEARYTSLTYWEANSGTYIIGSNSGYGTFSVLTGGPYKGGDYAVGTFKGKLTTIVMPRQPGGTDPPLTSTFSLDFSKSISAITAWRIVCYFPPITPVSPYHACTGQAAARLVAAARAGRVTPELLAGFSDPILSALTPGTRRRGRRRRRA
jgi:hypothetical protein